jgi:hypothetical protein
VKATRGSEILPAMETREENVEPKHYVTDERGFSISLGRGDRPSRHTFPYHRRETPSILVAVVGSR